MSKDLNRRDFIKYTAGLASAALLAGCGAAASTPTAIQSSTPGSTPVGMAATAAGAGAGLLRFAWWTDTGNMTPFQVSTTGPGGAVLLSLIFDTLTWKDEKGVIPWLSSAWTAAPDGLSYTFNLIKGATWHDGKPLSADDVKFSYDYYAAHPYKWMPAPMIAGAAVMGADQVKITLKRPYAAFIEDIAGILPIIPRHVWESVADPLKYSDAAATVGSGPFKFVSHDEATGAYRLLANSGYWHGRPLFAEWREFTVAQEQRVQIVQQGAADVSLSSDASVRDLLANDARLKVFETAPLSLVRLVVNTRLAPLDRKEVRQALAYALDRKTIAATVTKGPPIVGSAGVVPPETPWYNPSLPQYDYDPAKARQLLGGQTFTLDLIADASAREPALMAPMLEAVGIKLNVQQVDAATRNQLLGAGKFQIALTSHIGVGGDPDYLRRWYTGEEANAFAKGSIFDNAAYTALGNQEAAALDPQQRRQIVFQMQEILADELPTIVLYHRRFYWIYDPAIFTPMNTAGGLMNGIPFPNNKLALIAR